ncbi:hypothetical protein C8P63_1296 [Melghirimyces profundicolus]|uniref:Uncharacterized protein n=1 Tax=Melghirimyces profundicolus TaxID=1242148 RepID=A0A2T6BAF2_9BACL|nr:hypothetical protein C8P63_1296 [Melghirimyces profundicolus]
MRIYTTSIFGSLITAGIIIAVSMLVYFIVKGIITRVANRKLKTDDDASRFHTLTSVLTA